MLTVPVAVKEEQPVTTFTEIASSRFPTEGLPPAAETETNRNL